MSARMPPENRIAAVAATPPLPLTSDEMCLVNLFRATDHRGKIDMITMARCVVKVGQKYHKKNPLRLVVGGAS
jgi:hypothetical protein